MILLYSIAILLGAALLFWVQLFFGKLLLPGFGGTPAVWNTCLLFYQAVLLGGYAYADLLGRLLVPRRQAVVHALVLLAPAALLPVGLPAGWEPPGDANPVPWLLGALALGLGVPFFVLSTTSPLLQRWFSRLGLPRSHDPYPLYAASNLGSMLGLLGYPLLVEPNATLAVQASLWSWGYALYVLLGLACAAALLRAPASAHEGAAQDPAPAPLPSQRLQWLLLSFVPAALLYGVTTMLATDVASVPLLWIVPLGLYLLSFVLAFASWQPLPFGALAAVLPLGLAAMVITLLLNLASPAAPYLALHLAGFLTTAFVLHRELALRRPAAEHLTGFYLWISLGGLLAGLYCAILAPMLYDSVLEYPMALLLAGLLLHAARIGGTGMGSVPRVRLAALTLALGALLLLLGAGFSLAPLPASLPGHAPLLLALLGIALAFRPGRLVLALGLAAGVMLGQFAPRAEGLLHASRSFFGVHRVYRVEGRYQVYQHGTTVHGRQSLDPALRRTALSYFHPSGPIGQALGLLYMAHPIERVAVLGLGAGSLAAYSSSGQQWDFYEIDPTVEAIALDPSLFTFLADARGECRVILGDARLSLQRTAAAPYDLIVADVFSSDAIPVHLFTREAFELYFRRLAPEGVLALHITNRFLDLEPVLGAIAAELGLVGVAQWDGSMTAHEAEIGKAASHWALVARRSEHLGALARRGRWRPLAVREGVRAWTDDYSDVLGVLQLGR
jgi:hypothetical protein